MKIVTLYSGGLDSGVLLYHLQDEGHELHAISIDYGQRHRCELNRAKKVCLERGIAHRVADLSSIQPLLTGSCLTSPEMEVPEGHYTTESMKSTVVPNRNMIFLSIATGYALSIQAGQVAYAAHSGDHTIYPDCRIEFAKTMARAIRLADWESVQLILPFGNWTKADIVRRGAELQVPFIQTWSCYKGGETHCGRCGTCVERREAFERSGVEDPTPYASDAPAIETLRAKNRYL